MWGELEILYRQIILDNNSSILNIPYLVIVCTHQHTATSVPILVLVVVTLSSHNIVGGGWSSATPYSVGVDQLRGCINMNNELPRKLYTLVLVIEGDRILLGLKKRRGMEEAAKRYSSG